MKNQMKNLFVISAVLVVLLFSCSDVQNYYAGFVVDESGQPIPDVIVRENMIGGDSRQTFTDENGYFKLKRDPSIICNLIFEKYEYKSDTILIFRDMGDDIVEYHSILTSDTSKIVLRKLVPVSLQTEEITKDNELAPDIEKLRFSSKYNFETFKADVFSGTLSEPDFVNNKFASDNEYVDFITDGCKKAGINFGGHYSLIHKGCGAMCEHLYVVDRVSGKIFTDIKLGEGKFGYLYNPDSRLLVANSNLFVNDSLNYYVDYGMDIKPELYVWTGKSFKRLQ